jgi:2-dehydropantoate 2-reductase
VRYVVVGAGAVGGATAALLHEAGRDVQLVARGRTLAALRTAGLDLAVGDRTRAVPVPTLAGLHEATWDRQSVLVLAVKSQHTPDVLPALADVPAHVPVLCLQNSVANERLLLEHRDPATVRGWS